MATTLNEEYSEDVTSLELTDEVKSSRLVNYFISSFKSKSVILELNENGLPKIVELPVLLEDWEQTTKNFDDILRSKAVSEDARIRLVRLLNSNANRITDHLVERQRCVMHAGRKAKLERIEKAKTMPPIEVSISQALRMHEGNVKVRGLISSGSDRIEKMITRVSYRCGECDALNELADYRQTRPRFAYEVPLFNLRDKKCMMGCESYRHEPFEEPVNAYKIELQDTETFNDLERLPVVLFEECTNKVKIGEQVVVTGSIQRIRRKGRLLTYVFVGLDSNSTVEYESRKGSDELTDADIQEFQNIAKFTKRVKDKITGKEIEVNTVIDTLVSKLATSAIGLEHVRKGILFAAANSGKDTYERKLRINVLLIGETGLNKSPLLRASTRLVSNSRFISSLNSSVKSQVGIVDKDEDSYMLRLGPIPRAAGAICAVDEIGRMRLEDQEQLLHALQEGKMPFVKHGFDLLLDGRATFIMSSNPKNSSGNWNDKEKINLNEIPLLGPLRDRVGLIFIFRTNRQVGYVADYAFRKAKIINTIEEVNAEEDKNYEFLRKYLLYCKRFEPTLSKEAEVMIVQYYVNIMTKPESYHSPRLFDTLTSLCYAVTRLKQKDLIDVDDVNDVTEFYNEQLLHLSKLVSIPRDPREFAYEEIINSLKDKPFGFEFSELVRTVSSTNVFIREYFGEDLHVRSNRRLRELRDKFAKFEDNRILILSYSPLTLAWKDSYRGGDMDTANDHNEEGEDTRDGDSNKNKTTQEGSARKRPESDVSDVSDKSDGDIEDNENDRMEEDKVPPRPQIPFTTADKDKMSPVTHVTHVTSAQTNDHINPSNPTSRNTASKDAVEFLTTSERNKCIQTSLTDEQIDIFCRVFKDLEAESNMNPGSFSSDDKGTVGGEELRSRIVSSGNTSAEDATWIVNEMHKIKIINRVAFDTFKRASA